MASIISQPITTVSFINRIQLVFQSCQTKPAKRPGGPFGTAGPLCIKSVQIVGTRLLNSLYDVIHPEDKCFYLNLISSKSSSQKLVL